MANKIILNNDGALSHWIEIEQNAPFCVSTEKIDTDNIDDLVNAIVSEFKLTEPDILPLLRDKIETWLLNSKDKTYEINDQTKTRDFIYEMF
jgi:hypothetical protein